MTHTSEHNIDLPFGNNADLYSRNELRAMLRKAFVQRMAQEFRVQAPLMELRLQNTGPWLPIGDEL